MTQFSWPVRVYYEDTDAGGVVYYANYLKYFERARTEFLRELGFEQDVLRENEGVIFAVKSIQVDYIQPARFNDYLSVTAQVTAIRRASLDFQQEILKDQSPLCRASVRIVCLNAEAFRPCSIPPSLRTVLNK
ncbi:MAG: 4-hydroxybenzoyl-CoA thioesterase [Methylothermaceae bacteria B42]|nr:MAG: 4-hydroxybenzoyl-CoA thioesterase [Methylothermaceae bacteria B42]HHJ39008.1 tol-pal system-associated acyl-CoA thioesterase [Methylothermaceae bacterium]